MSLAPKFAPNIASLSLQSNASGYVAVPFPGKDKQFDQVLDELDKAGFIPESLIEQETKWFYEELGIDDVFFARESVAGIVGHIHALYAAKLEQYAAGKGDSPNIKLAREYEDHAVYFESDSGSVGYEQRIDEKYLNTSNSAASFRVESFRESNLGKIRLHFVYKTDFIKHSASKDAEFVDVDTIGDRTFSKIASENTKELYSSILKQASKTMGPVINHYEVAGSAEYRLVIAYRQNTTTNYSSALSALLRYYGLVETRRYVEQFSNGLTVISLYIVAPSSVSSFSGPSELSVYQVIKEASLLYCLPNNTFSSLFETQQLSLQESIYAHCGAIFATHFLNRLGPEFAAVKSFVTPGNGAPSEALEALRKRLRSETYSTDFIQGVLTKHKSIVQQLYRHFADVHYVRSKLERTLSYERLRGIDSVGSDADFANLLAKKVGSESDSLVLNALFTFNKSILKTNFYSATKVAISFRLKPTFLPKEEYPAVPFGMFFVVGADFRGFHIRFRDIARGGIRIVQSRNEDAYAANARTLIDENYGLASTQQRKNKDIPEGGSKGVILLNPGPAQTRPKASFEKYIDAILDLLLSTDNLVDLYKDKEILFMGPDEGTSGFVDWATIHARQRGAPWWKSFFTGKSPTLGGIPHDEYGMTTLSVRTYVEEIYSKEKIGDKKITKFQTGGPGGDLGSNEILLSSPNEVYIAIVDGPAVVGDPNGLDKKELERLAHARLDISFYDKSKLSSKGYLVKVDDQDVVLPNGLSFANGVALRNKFHLILKDLFGHIDLFVPCGGRPASIDTSNVNTLIEDGKSIIPYIVEGANLFITQDAKLALEKAGAVLFKDASTNKGGVTSSSKEVLASLVLDDGDFLKNMCVSEGKVPEFYAEYVKQVQALIKEKAKLEFHALWNLKEKTGKPFSVLSDELSVAINDLADSLAESQGLWEDAEFRNAILKDSIPKLLLDEVKGGIEAVVKRVPEAYLRRLFSTQIAGGFVYEKGFGGVVEFFEFVEGLKKSYKL